MRLLQATSLAVPGASVDAYLPTVPGSCEAGRARFLVTLSYAVVPSGTFNAQNFDRPVCQDHYGRLLGHFLSQTLPGGTLDGLRDYLIQHQKQCFP